MEGYRKPCFFIACKRVFSCFAESFFMKYEWEKIYLSDGGNPNNIKGLFNENRYNLETLYFAMPETLEGNIEDKIGVFKNIKDNLCVKKLIMHGPFFDLAMVSKEESILKLTRRRYEQAFSIALELNIKRIVFHTQFNSHLRFESYTKEWLKNSQEYFNYFLTDFPHYQDIELTIENMFEDDPATILQLMEAVNNPRVGVCLDVGHVNVYSSKDYKYWIDTLSSHIKYIHLSDNMGAYDEHLPLGKGNINFDEIFTLFEQNSLHPDLCIEMNNEEYHRISINYLQTKGIIQPQQKWINNKQKGENC